MERYRQLLGYVKSAVTRNAGEKVINSILDHVSLGESQSQQELLAEFYETTLVALEEAKNERCVQACHTYPTSCPPAHPLRVADCTSKQT